MYKDSFTFDLGHFIFRRMKLSKLTIATWLSRADEWMVHCGSLGDRTALISILY